MQTGSEVCAVRKAFDTEGTLFMRLENDFLFLQSIHFIFKPGYTGL